MATLIYENLTANGQTDWVEIVNPNTGGTIYQNLYVSGNFGGGTVTPQVSIDGGATPVSVSDSNGAISLTDDAMRRLDMLGTGVSKVNDNQKLLFRVDLSSATTPDINVLLTDTR